MLSVDKRYTRLLQLIIIILSWLRHRYYSYVSIRSHLNFEARLLVRKVISKFAFDVNNCLVKNWLCCRVIKTLLEVLLPALEETYTFEMGQSIVDKRK